MHNWLPIIFIKFLAVSSSRAYAEETSASINNVLHSDQFIFVAQQDCYRYLETNVRPGECPQVVTNPHGKYLRYRYVGLHLLRDSKGIFPPKIMTVADAPYRFGVQIPPLNASEAFEEGRKKCLDNTSELLHFDYKRPFGSVAKAHEKSLVHSVFDNTNRMLYLDFTSSDWFHVEQYYVYDIFSEKPGIKHIITRSGKSLKKRYDFVEDPYSNMFYYKEDMNNTIMYFEAELDQASNIISGALSGKQVDMLSMYGTLYGVANGTFFGTKIKKSDHDEINFTFATSEKSESQFNCPVETKSQNMPTSNKLIIIRDNDYCMLRDGINYNKEKCVEERKNYFEKVSEVNVLVWLTILCIILFAIIILLCVYVHWLRNTFITAEEQIAQNEQETEASLFIAKQRSFPTSYQDPALLDISVDRWN